MYKRVDGTVGDEELEGFSYLNLFDEEEFVTVVGDDIVAVRIGCSSVHVFDQDIPKLIKALQAAYDYKVLKVA